MQRTLLSFFLMFMIFAVQAQTGIVSGRVNTQKGNPVAGATVLLKEIGRSGITDNQGSYEISSVKADTYTLIISSLETERKSFRIKVSGTITMVDAMVKVIEDRDLELVAIEGKTAKKKIETSGFAVNVIDTKEAAKRNLQTNELLDRTVGVRVLQSGGLGSEVQYNLNGMTGRSVGIFIDGIEISTYGTSFNLNSIPPAMIERIEVYKGVLPAHLSGDLLGGAINIILKKGEGSNNFTISTSYGSFNTFQSDFSGMYRNAKNGLTLKGSGFYTKTDNNYEIWGKFAKYIEPNGIVTRNYRTKRFWDGYRALGGRVEAGFTAVKWADVFLLSYNGSDDYKEIQHGQTMGTPYMGRFRETNAHVFNLNYIKKDLFTRGLDVSFNGVYSDRATYLQDTVRYAYNWDGNIRTDLSGKLLKSRNGAQQGAPTITDIGRQIVTLRSNLTYELFTGHRISLNHVYYTVDREDTNLLNLVEGNAVKGSNDLAKNVFSLNYELRAWKDKLITNLFAKYYQQHSANRTPIVNTVNGQQVVNMAAVKNTDNATGYGAAVAYTLKPRWVLVTSVERAVRMPDGNEIFGDPAENILANTGLNPEISDNINFGFRLGTFTFNKHKFSLSTNVFWRNTKDKIMRRVNQLLSDAETEVAPFINLGLAQSLGFEGELGYIYNNNLNVMLNFSKFNSLYKTRLDPITGQQLTYYNKQVPNEPFFTMNANVQYTLNNILQKSSTLNLFYTIGYVGPFKTIWPESEWFVTPAQYAQNLGLSYRFPNRRIIASFDLKNMFNSEIYDNFGVQKPGRAIFFKLNYAINKF